MNLETLVGALVVLGTGGYFFWYHQKLASRTQAGQGPELFHEAMVRNTKGLEPDERTVVAWFGQVWTPPTSTTRQLVGGALDAISKEAIGVSRYVPLVKLLVLSSGRVVVTQEHSDLGERDHYHVARAWLGAVRATKLSGDEYGTPPKNPFDPRTSMSLYRLDSSDGSEPYVCWLSPTCMSVRGDTSGPDAVLPVSAEEAAQAWRNAVESAKANAVA